MKGVIFNLLEEFAVETFGAEFYEEILDEVDLITTEPFVGPGTYPDEDLLAIVAALVRKADMPLPQAVRTFGHWLFPRLAERVPPEMLQHDSAKSFLQTVHDIIHVEVRKLYAEAQPPDFTYEDPGPDRLIIRYRSRRRMFDLMDGLLAGVADHYGTTIDFERVLGDDGDTAIYDIRFGGAS